MSESENPTLTTQHGRYWGYALAALVLVLDQASKLYVLHGMGLVQGVRVPMIPTIDFTLVWNYGISYGLFQQSSDWGRWILVALTSIVTIILTIWLTRSHKLWLSIALGILIGGAIGNLIDRVLYGAVIDFVLFHISTFEWYVFNVADAAIVAGVLGLLYDSMRGESPAQ
jgi:signal peptidase II